MLRLFFALLLSVLLSCAPKETAARVPEGDIFLRLYKSDPDVPGKGRLEMFSEGDDGLYSLWKVWPICTWSGAIGPKLREGDGHSPEGFYYVTPSAMNPNSSYHLSFNLGFPNAYDRAQGRTGSFLMVHGDCVSIGCYAMTDAGIEEIYGAVQAAFDRGQAGVRVHIFPFPMSTENFALVSSNPNIDFWRNLATDHDWFETTGRPPNVDVENGRYIFEPLP